MVEFRKLDVSSYNDSHTLKISGARSHSTLNEALTDLKDSKGSQAIVTGNDDFYYVIDIKDRKILNQSDVLSSLMFVESADEKTVKSNQALMSSVYVGKKEDLTATNTNRENLINQLMVNGLDSGEIDFIANITSEKNSLTTKGRQFVNMLAEKPEFQTFMKELFTKPSDEAFGKNNLLKNQYSVLMNSLSDTPKGKDFIVSLVTLPEHGFINQDGNWTNKGINFAKNLLQTGSGSEIVADLLTNKNKYNSTPYIDESGNLNKTGLNLMKSLSVSDRFDNKMVLTKILSGPNGSDLFHKLLTQKDSIYLDKDGFFNETGKSVVKTLVTLSSDKYSGMNTLRNIAENTELPESEKNFINESIDTEIKSRFNEAFPKIQAKNRYQSGESSRGQRDLGMKGQTDCYDCACDITTALGKGKTNRPDLLYKNCQIIAKYNYQYSSKTPDKLDEAFIKQLKPGDVIRVMPDQHWAVYVGDGKVAHGNWYPGGTDYIVKDNAIEERDPKINPHKAREPVITSINEITRFGDRRNITVFRPPY